VTTTTRGGKLVAALRAIRKDGWENAISGLGTVARDRAAGLDFVRSASLSLTTLSDLFRQDDICRKIVEIYPKEDLRHGFSLVGPFADGAAAAIHRLDLRRKVLEASVWGRLYGGAVIIVGDGSPDQSLPRAPGAIVRYLDVYDRRFVQRESIVTDPSRLEYGMPELLRVTTASGESLIVHRSRCIIFGGAMTGRQEREANGGWDDSVLEVVIRTVRAFNSGFLSLDSMLTDASQGVLKMSGVISSLGSDEGRATMQTRAQLFELMRGVTRSLFLDAEENESYEKIATAFAGVPESIDRLGQRLSAATDIPVTRLIGVSAAGMNATGDGEARNWADSVLSWRRHEMEPQVEQLVSWIAPGHQISWPPLWSPSALEAAQIDKLLIDSWAVTVQNDILSPEALTISAANLFNIEAPEIPQIEPINGPGVTTPTESA